MDENARAPQPLPAGAVMREAMVQSALHSAARAEDIGLGRDRIILSAKVSDVQHLIAVYRTLARRSDYALHLGLTEAGMGSKGIVASSAAMGILLQEGLGDTVEFPHSRARRRPFSRSQGGTRAITDDGISDLRAPGCRLPRLWTHHIHRFSRTCTRYTNLSPG